MVGTDAFTKGLTDPVCDANEAQAFGPNVAQTTDTTVHPYRDDYWAHDPESLAKRVHVPILGCVNWQDMTVYSRAFDEFRDEYNPKTTWVVGGDGSHTDCPISRAPRALPRPLPEARRQRLAVDGAPCSDPRGSGCTGA